MLCYDRINVSGGIEVNEKSASKEHDNCHYYYFSDEGIKVQPDVCNGCHDILMISLNLDNGAILNIQSIDYHYNINRISKSITISYCEVLTT